MGIYGKGISSWETIKKQVPNKTRPDYCTYRKFQDSASLKCYQRQEGRDIPIEKSKFVMISCTSWFQPYSSYECSSRPVNVENFKEYKRWMRYAGDGSPTKKDKTMTEIRSALEVMSFLSFLAFPFLLFKSKK